jgi:biotin transport system substrate-specific component
MVGLPVFAGTPEKGMGIIYFVGPTMGYLLGFLIAVFFAGFFKYGNNHIVNFFKLIFAVSIIYLLGMLWLVKFTGWEKVFMVGAQPFLLAELFKILILTALIPKIRKNK